MMRPLGIGRDVDLQTPGRDDDEAPDGGFGGPQHTLDGAVQAPGNAPNCAAVRDAQQDEQAGYDRRKCQAIALDGPRPIHAAALPPIEHSKNVWGRQPPVKGLSVRAHRAAELSGFLRSHGFTFDANWHLA
jgi:hypothetical protein